MRVFKPKRSNVYRVRYTLSDGVQRDRPLRTHIKEVAEAKARQLVEEEEKELHGLLPPRKLREAAVQPLATHLVDFVAEMEEKQRHPDHVKHARARLTAVFAKCRWQLLRDVTSDSFVKWRTRAEGLSSKTLNEYLGHAVAFFNWLVRHDRFTHNPLKNVSKLTIEETFKRRALSVDEFNRLVQAAGPRRLVYFVACCTGLRRGEMQQLLWSDIELEGDEPRITLRPETTKNKKGGRIPLLPALAELLRAEKAKGVWWSGRVFHKGLPSVKTLHQDLEAAKIQIEDERGFRVDFHALRHTFASLLANAGVSELVRMKLTRHSEWKQTDRYTDEKSIPLEGGIAQLAKALPPSASSLASRKNGQNGPKSGTSVQMNTSPVSENGSVSDEGSACLAGVGQDWENEKWRRGGDSNPR